MLNVSILGSQDDNLLSRLRERGFRVDVGELGRVDAPHAGAKGPDAFVVDIRSLSRLPAEVGHLRQRFPESGVVIVARSLESSLLLDAMRMGVNEWVVEPLDIDDVVATLNRIGRRAAKQQFGRSIAVLGAKGGVGGTTVAVNLATSLHVATQEPTLLMDLHLAHGDAAVFLGVEPRFSTIDALENLHRLDEAYFKGLVTPTKAGVDLLGSSTSLLTGSVEAARVRSLIAFASTVYRHVVLDCPRTDATMLEALDAVSQVVVITNQELTTIRAASRIVSGLRQRCGPDRVKLAISRVDPQAEIAQEDMERVLGARIKYVLPSDYRTSVQAITRGEPLILQNHSRLASTLNDVAHDLGGLPPRRKDAGKSGLFGRLSARRSGGE